MYTIVHSFRFFSTKKINYFMFFFFQRTPKLSKHIYIVCFGESKKIAQNERERAKIITVMAAAGLCASTVYFTAGMNALFCLTPQHDPATS